MTTTSTMPPFVARRTAAALAAIGCALLVMRPVIVRATARPVISLLGVFAALFVVGRAWPIAEGAPARVRPVVVASVGIGAFTFGRFIGGGHAPHGAALTLIVLNSVAAVAEEAFFRRLVYGLLEPGGVAVAVGGSALLFAVVHVTVYGAWVFPIDLAAGLVLSWQRWVSGSWRIPAITHVLANVLVVL